MFIAIIYISFIAALITIFSTAFREKILKWPLITVAAARWFMTEGKSDILKYLSGEFLGGVTADVIIQPYSILLCFYVAVSAVIAYWLVKSSLKTNFTKEKNFDVITAALIIFIIVTNLFGTIQMINKFYDSSYIYSTPAARGILIIWASLFIRRYLAAKNIRS